jgi:hypothetical protein
MAYLDALSLPPYDDARPRFILVLSGWRGPAPDLERLNLGAAGMGAAGFLVFSEPVTLGGPDDDTMPGQDRTDQCDQAETPMGSPDDTDDGARGFGLDVQHEDAWRPGIGPIGARITVNLDTRRYDPERLTRAIRDLLRDVPCSGLLR